MSYPEFEELHAAWVTWGKAPGDRAAAVRLCEASTAAAPRMGVPAYRVSVVLAEGLKHGLSHREVIEHLADDIPFDRPPDTYCVHCGPTAKQLAAIQAGDLDSLYPTYEGEMVNPATASDLPSCGHGDIRATHLGAEAYRHAVRAAS